MFWLETEPRTTSTAVGAGPADGRRPTTTSTSTTTGPKTLLSMRLAVFSVFFSFLLLLLLLFSAGKSQEEAKKRRRVDKRSKRGRPRFQKRRPSCVCVCVCRENTYCRRHHWSAQKFNGVFFSALFFFLLSSGPVESRHATRTKYDEIKTKPDTKKKRPHRRGSTRRSGVTTLDRHWSQSLNDVIVGRSKSRKGAQRLCRRPHNVVAQDGVEPPHWAFIGRNR